MLLLLLIALLVLSAADRTPLLDAAIGLGYLGCIALAVRATAVPVFHVAAVTVSAGALVTMVLVLSPADGDVVRGFAAIAQGLVAGGTLFAVILRVLQHEEVRGETIAGAICAYLLIGLLFASGYAATDLLGSQSVLQPEARSNDYSYFSFITLTTTGYGDFVPGTDVARRVAMIEAMTGQIFLATTVARLVALYRPRRERRPTMES
jgi:hypothetical protein